MRLAASFVFLGFLLVQCSSPPPPAIWTDQARRIVDSVRYALAVYQDRFNAADRDSVLRFYAQDDTWPWVVDGRVGKPSSLMMRSRLDRLAVYPQWHLWYTNLTVIALAPGLASVTADYRMVFGGRTTRTLIYDGALTMFWKHRPEGWKAVGGHTSSLPVVSR